MASLLTTLRVSLTVLPLLIHAGITASQETDFVIAGYLPDYRSYINVNATTPFLTDLMLFSKSLKGTCCLGKDHYRISRQAQAYKQEKGHGSLRLWVTIGGGGRSEGFAEIASNANKQTQFLQELIHVCQEEGLQGVDFDWEIPRTHQEMQNYVELLLHAAKTLHDANLLISVALHARQFMPPQVYHAVDRVHLMTYDLSADHVAPYEMVVQSIQEFVQYQCPPSKLVLGIPAYGRHFQNPSLVKTFSELMDESSNEAISRQEWNGYRYDSPESIRRKVEYAIQHGLAGVFLWELGQDKQHEEFGPSGILLEAAAFLKKHSLDANTEL